MAARSSAGCTARVSLRSGEPLWPPAYEPVPVFPVKVDGGVTSYVAASEPARPNRPS